jgi:hypothetical protein
MDLHLWETATKMADHRRMGVRQDQLDARRGQGDGQAAGAGAQIQDRGHRTPSQGQPGFQICSVG